MRVTDHKTGKADGKPGQLIDGGKSLQPLLYALAAERLFAGEAVTSGRLYFCTSTGGRSPSRSFRSTSASRDDGLPGCRHGSARPVAQPSLPAAPDRGQCDICDYRVVCGPHEERRTARKPQENLGPLLAVRALP